MPNVTPGRWFNYASIPLLAAGGTTQIVAVPLGNTLYLDYFMATCYTALPDGLAIYFAADNIPIVTLVNGHPATEVSFSPPLIVQFQLIMGSLGTIDTAKNVLVAYSGTTT